MNLVRFIVHRIDASINNMYFNHLLLIITLYFLLMRVNDLPVRRRKALGRLRKNIMVGRSRWQPCGTNNSDLRLLTYESADTRPGCNRVYSDVVTISREMAHVSEKKREGNPDLGRLRGHADRYAEVNMMILNKMVERI